MQIKSQTTNLKEQILPANTHPTLSAMGPAARREAEAAIFVLLWGLAGFSSGGSDAPHV